MGDTSTPSSGFEKARTGLWESLQKHLATLYAAEKAFLQSVAFTDSFPFSLASVGEEQLADYWKQRNALRDLYVDETAQLDTLTKAIRTKGYSEAEKKQLYLMLLGYMDIAKSVFNSLSHYRPINKNEDAELELTTEAFDRVLRFARLNVKGINGLVVLA